MPTPIEDGAEREAVKELLTDLDEFAFDRSAAIRAARINAKLVDAGKRIDETDVMIAATALSHEHPVVTRNVDHFERIGFS